MNILFTFTPNKVQSIAKEMDYVPPKGSGVQFSVDTLKDANGQPAFSGDDYTVVWFNVNATQTIFTSDMNYYVEVVLAHED
ncbi:MULTISPECIES: hypothetical protein [Spirosoma]|uniref:Uncharacterized protein n=1 Tax=Spirosoma liriopis TaxID=2937440 RepID=A0ABT0HPR3_9BACT|nr:MULTISPECIES: hypothetical protein [Spirosoma]MCK8494158.1 hypothetical protein [Spirosoma liriopis]UHG89172.1 hypothetical protein LQ777_13055 [Spirosoma oryzicola]